VPSAPASPGPGPDEVPGLDEDEPPGPDEEYDDPEHLAMPWDLDVAAIWAETDELAAVDAADTENLAERGLLAELAASDAGIRGRRGPGQPVSARRVPGWSGSPAGGFGAGQPLDVAPGGSVLLGFAERVADDEERLGAAADDELVGLICALDRAEASACSLKHAAVAELMRWLEFCIMRYTQADQAQAQLRAGVYAESVPTQIKRGTDHTVQRGSTVAATFKDAATPG